jgi:hypothetical protein
MLYPYRAAGHKLVHPVKTLCTHAVRSTASLTIHLQAKVPGARPIPFSDIYAKSEDRPLLNLETKTLEKDTARVINAVYCFMRLTIIASMHIVTFFVAPR